MYLCQMFPKSVSEVYHERLALLMLEAIKLQGPQPGAIHASLMPLFTDFRTAQVCARACGRVPVAWLQCRPPPPAPTHPALRHARPPLTLRSPPAPPPPLTQVKAFTYISQWLRVSKAGVPEAVKAALASLPGALVHLLRSVPEGALAPRKELLQAMRQLLGSQYRCE